MKQGVHKKKNFFFSKHLNNNFRVFDSLRVQIYGILKKTQYTEARTLGIVFFNETENENLLSEITGNFVMFNKKVKTKSEVVKYIPISKLRNLKDCKVTAV